MEIQSEIKVKSRGREKERERHGESQIPKKPGRETSPRNWSNPLLFRRPFILLIKHGDQWVTELCSVRSADSFYTSFCIQKVSGDLHYLLAKRLVKTLFGSLP